METRGGERKEVNVYYYTLGHSASVEFKSHAYHDVVHHEK
jgi:hypothetical protein